MYKNMPVIVIDDLSILTPKLLDEYVDTYGWMCHDPKIREQYTMSYWMDRIIE